MNMHQLGTERDQMEEMPVFVLRGEPIGEVGGMPESPKSEVVEPSDVPEASGKSATIKITLPLDENLAQLVSDIRNKRKPSERVILLENYLNKHLKNDLDKKNFQSAKIKEVKVEPAKQSVKVPLKSSEVQKRSGRFPIEKRRNS